MPFEEFLSDVITRHFNDNVFPPTLFYWQTIFLFCFFCFSKNKKQQKFYYVQTLKIFKTKVCSKLALQPTDNCTAFTQRGK